MLVVIAAIVVGVLAVVTDAQLDSNRLLFGFQSMVISGRILSEKKSPAILYSSLSYIAGHKQDMTNHLHCSHAYFLFLITVYILHLAFVVCIAFNGFPISNRLVCLCLLFYMSTWLSYFLGLTLYSLQIFIAFLLLYLELLPMYERYVLFRRQFCSFSLPCAR